MPNTTEFAALTNVVAQWPTNAIAAVVIGVTFVLHFVCTEGYGRFNKARVPTFLGLVPIWPAWAFFTRRHDFLRDGFDRVKQDFFQFNVTHVINESSSRTGVSLTLFLQHKVVAMRGAAARKVFFGDHNLSFTEGYQILFGGVSLACVATRCDSYPAPHPFRPLDCKTSTSRSKKHPAMPVTCLGSKSELRTS